MSTLEVVVALKEYAEAYQRVGELAPAVADGEASLADFVAANDAYNKAFAAYCEKVRAAGLGT